MARAREILGLDARASYREAAAKTVAVRSEEVFEHAAGVLELADIERVHDMRVATRRLQAALQVFAPCLPKSIYKRVLREVKQLADALGERRDRDVQIAALESFAAQAPPTARDGVATLISTLRDEQLSANEQLARALEAARGAGLRDDLAQLAEHAR